MTYALTDLYEVLEGMLTEVVACMIPYLKSKSMSSMIISTHLRTMLQFEDCLKLYFEPSSSFASKSD